MNPVDAPARPSEKSRARPALRLSENQRKVITDKYLRTDPSPEVWLERVAANIALGELLHAPEADGWHLWDGVKRENSEQEEKEREKEKGRREEGEELERVGEEREERRERSEGK